MDETSRASSKCRHILAFAAMCLTLLPMGGGTHAKEPSAAATAAGGHETQKEFKIHFRVNSAVVEAAFANNARQLSELVDYIERLQNDSQYEITRIHFWGATSPDGSFQLNRSLAYLRSDALERFVCGRADIPVNRISRSRDYIPWGSLRTWAENSGIAQKQAVLDIIDRESAMEPYGADYSIDRRVVRLQQLDGGRVWARLRSQFPDMRQAGVCISSAPRTEEPEAPAEEPAVATPQLSQEPEVAEISRAEETDNVPEAAIADSPVDSGRGWRMLVKTDVAGWALAMTNLAVEIDICPHLSFSLPVYYSFVNYFADDLKFRVFGIRPELRYWLSPGNEGFFANAHFGLAHFNFALKGDYRYQAHDGNTPALGGGLGLGYRLPLNRHWRLEFVAGAGVYKTHYDRFRNVPGGAMVDSRRQVWIGLDQFTIAVGYSFGSKKGGAR